VTVIVGWGLAVALVALVGLAVLASWVGKLGNTRDQVTAAVRAVVQLAVVSLIIAAAVQTIPGAFAFTAVMFAVAVWTTTKRVDVRPCWAWTSLALLAGILPVLAVVFLSGAAPFNGISLVALGGIVTGNMMTAHTLNGRRVFAELRAGVPQYEAARSLGFRRPDAIGLVIERVVPESLIPNLDQTRTVGLVTLPGAFIGVLLGGGSPVQAGAAQVLVLVGIMAGQALTVVAMTRLVRARRIIPDDLRPALRA